MASNEKIDLKDQLKVLPKTPGVYQFYSIDDKILYVGKAKNLKDRVSSYLKISLITEKQDYYRLRSTQ